VTVNNSNPPSQSSAHVYLHALPPATALIPILPLELKSQLHICPTAAMASFISATTGQVNVIAKVNL